MDNFFTSNKTSSNYSRTYSKGKSFKFSVWNSKDTYNNDEFVQDFVQWNQKLWAAKKTSTNIPPIQGEYWELIVDGVSDVEFKQEDNRILWKYEDDLEWKDLFELASVSEDQIRKMLEDLDIKYGNTYDVKLSETSTNAVQNQVVTKKFKELDNKNTKIDSELTNIKSSVNTALSNSKSYTDSKISETKTQIDSELNKKANQTDVNGVVNVLNENINLKVDKISGKGLSTNDFNNNYKSKLDNLDSSLNSTLTSAKSYTNSEITKVDNKINSEISRAKTSETNLSNKIDGLEEDVIEALNEAKEYTDTLANGEVKNNTNKINILNGTGEGSVIKTVKDEISYLVGTAPEKLDTLQEIADYLEEHEDMASGLVNSLSELETKKADKTELINLKTETDSALQSLEKSKANTTDYYPQMSVGQADNLPDRGDVTEGFIGFRESAGAGNSIEDGTANVQELLGDSLVWNQKVQLRNADLSTSLNGVTITDNRDGSFTVVTEATGATADVEFRMSGLGFWSGGHKYCVLGCPAGGSESTYYMRDMQFSTYYLVDYGQGCVFTAPNSKGMRPAIIVKSGTIITTPITFRPRYHDLTQMFGAGKEPTTVEEFNAIKNQLVGVDFNAYNEGEVLGVNIKGIKSVNDNAFNGEYAKVLGGREYCADGTITSMGFAKEIGGATEAIVLDSENKFTPSENGYVYASGTDICIHLVHTGYKDHVYTEHEESESSFDLTPYFPNGMHGLNGVRDSATPKKATRRFGAKKMKDLSWQLSPNNNGVALFRASVPSDITAYISGQINNLLTARYYTTTWDKQYVATDIATINKTLARTSGQIIIADSSYTDAASFVASLTDDDILIYELATPIETEIDPQLNMNYKVWDFGTEELLTDGKSAPVLARTIYGFNATDTIRGNKAKNEEQDARLHALESEVVRKGDYSPDNSVGFADDLVGRGESVLAEFSFRASGGKSIKDGAARIKRLKGNSVVWNQKLIRDNETAQGITTTWADNIATLSGTATSTYAEIQDSRVPIFNGHKYLVEGWVVSNPNGLSFGLGLFNNIPEQLRFDSSTAYKAGVFICNGNYRSGFGVNRFGGAGTDLTGLQLKARVIDLTQMFDSGNEPTTIEEFNARKPIVEDEYAYNEGEVIHMTAEGIKSVGDNAWDEEWEVGSFDLTTGEKVSANNFIRSSNKIKVIPNESYYISRVHPQMYAWLYDNNGNYINYVGLNTDNRTFNFGPNVHYINIRIGSTTEPVATYNNDIMITLVHSGWKQDTDAKYQPYWEDRLIFDQRIKDEFPNGMKKWDMVYNKNGKGYIVKGTGVVDMGDLNWAGSSEDAYTHAFRAYYDTNMVNDNVLCVLYSTYDPGTSAWLLDTRPYTVASNNGYIGVNDPNYTDAASFKAAMAGVMLCYKLAEPTIIEYDEPFNLDYKVADFGTEQAIAEQPSAPISADIIYQFNAVDMIREHELEIEELKTTIVNLQTLITQLQTSISSMGG